MKFMVEIPDEAIVPAALVLIDQVRDGRKLTLDQALTVFEVAVIVPAVADALRGALAERSKERV